MADKLLGPVPRRGRGRRRSVFLITAVTSVPTHHHKVGEWDCLVCVVHIHINRGWKLTCGMCEHVCEHVCVFKKKVEGLVCKLFIHETRKEGIIQTEFPCFSLKAFAKLNSC